MERATRVVRAAAAATPQGVTLPDSCFRSSLLALLPAAHDLPRFIALGLFGMFGNQARPNIYIRRSLQLVPQRTA